MIEQFKEKNAIDVLNFVNTYNDFFQEFYFTCNKERVFLKHNLKLIRKLLKYQTVYAIKNQDVDALMVIYKEKGYRPYVKFLVRQNKFYKDFLKFLRWNFREEFYFKIKETNPLLLEFVNKIIVNGSKKYVPKTDFFGKPICTIIGLRGKEILIKSSENKNVRHTFQSDKDKGE